MQGYIDESEECFRKDLDPLFYGRCHPNNIWSLKGLSTVLQRRLSRQQNGSLFRTPSDPEYALSRELHDIIDQIEKQEQFTDTDIKAACMCAAGAL